MCLFKSMQALQGESGKQEAHYLVVVVKAVSQIVDTGVKETNC